MRVLLDEQFAPITSSIGFLELPLQDAARGLLDWRQSLVQQVTTSRLEGFPVALRRLEPLVGGARPRELLVAAGRWTAYFDNLLRGTEAVSAIGHLSRTLQCSGLAVRVVPRTVGLRGVRGGRAGAVQFEMFGPLRTHFMNYVRTVAVTHDGTRWVFSAVGTEQDFEELDAYKSRRVRDRFTSDMLERYCQALGVDVFNPHAYGPEAVLFESVVALPAEPVVMTLAEAQAWLEIDPGIVQGLPG